MNQGESLVCPKMLAITKRAKICQNCQICWADFVLTNLTEIHQNLSAILISLWQVWLKCGEIVKPWTFNWFDKILSNMPFSLLHTFLDISGNVVICSWIPIWITVGIMSTQLALYMSVSLWFSMGFSVFGLWLCFNGQTLLIFLQHVTCLLH